MELTSSRFTSLLKRQENKNNWACRITVRKTTASTQIIVYQRTFNQFKCQYKKILPDFHYLLYVEWLAKALGKIYFQVVTYLDQALNHWLCDGVCLGGSSLAGWASMAPYWDLCVCGPFRAAAGSTHKPHCIQNPLLF